MVRQDLAIPTRFILTVGHFILVCLSYFHKSTNIASGLPSGASASSVDSADASFTAAFALSIVCFVFHFVGIFGGFSIFFTSINLLQILCQFLGGLLTALFVLDGWHYNAFWVLFAFFSFVPALAEISVLIGVFGLKVIKY